MTCLGFDDAELRANQSGRLSDRQAKRLQLKEQGARTGAWFLGSIHIAASLVGLGIGASMLFGASGASPGFRIVIGVVFGIVWALIWGTAGILTLRRAFTPVSIRIDTVVGPANIVKVVRRQYNSSTRTHIDYAAYELHVGGRTFDVRNELPGIMMQGDVYAVHFAEFNARDRKKELLSAEWRSPAGPETESATLVDGDAEVVYWLKEGNMLGAIREYRRLHGAEFDDAWASVEAIQRRIKA